MLELLMESFLDFQPLTPQLSSIGVPTTILNGEFDFLTPRALHETLRVHIPNSSLVIIPRAYHAFTLEKPALTADLLARFADDVLALAGQQGRLDCAGKRRWRTRSVSRRLRSSARDPCAGNDPMSEFFGPLDSEGRVPPCQQTRVAAFLISAHGALARQFAFALPVKLESAWQTELNAQFHREPEIVSLLLRATNLGARPRCGLYGCILGNGLVSKVGRRNCGSTPGVGSISRRARMPCMLASGRLPCCRLWSMPTTPSSWHCAASNSRAAACCRRKSCC